MSIRFGRQYQIIVGRPTQLAKFIIPISVVNPRLINEGPYQTTDSGDVIDWNSIPPEWYEILGEKSTDLQITADINQAKSVSVPCTIKIVNAGQDEINRVRKDDLVILRGGYKQVGGNFVQAVNVGVGREQWPDLFVGQVVRINTEQKGTDRVTTILCGEAITVKKNSKVSKSWVPQTTRADVLNDMVAMLQTQGIPLGRLTLPQVGSNERVILDKPLLMGYTIKGYLMDELETLCSNLGLRVYTATGKLYVEPNTLFLSPSNSTQQLPVSVEVFDITPDLVKGRVQTNSDNVGQSSNTAGDANTQGITFRVWLEGQVTIAKVVRLSGFQNNFDGDYEITSVRHKLDFRSKSTWDTIITAKRL